MTWTHKTLIIEKKKIKKTASDLMKKGKVRQDYLSIQILIFLLYFSKIKRNLVLQFFVSVYLQLKQRFF